MDRWMREYISLIKPFIGIELGVLWTILREHSTGCLKRCICHVVKQEHKGIHLRLVWFQVANSRQKNYIPREGSHFIIYPIRTYLDQVES